MKIKKTFTFVGHEKDIETLSKLFRHIEYLGDVGASRNLVIRVDGDGSGRIKVFNEDGTKIDSDQYNIKQEAGAIVGVYDIG